jgi:hypothetical protein
MKRLLPMVGVALITFTLGVLLNGLFSRAVNLVSEQTPIRKNATIHVEFLKVEVTDHRRYGDFRVTNNSAEVAKYYGYGKESHCSNLTRQIWELKSGSHCWCGTGRSGQTLSPGESVVFQIRVPDGNFPFDAGFDFTFGEQDEKRTYWSGLIDLNQGQTP